MRSNTSQIVLIASGILVTALFGVFFYRELFPEYMIYQKDYVALEEFRSTYTHQPPTIFKYGVKQILFEREDLGPPVIDRCTSCHVALQIPYFSPTKVDYDENGKVKLDSNGFPIQIHNEEYIWEKLDNKIAELLKQGDSKEAKRLEALKSAKVGDFEYDMTKVLVAHPLIGKETRPFEFHSIDEYGCTSCHNGNGRALTTDKAHGPVFDGQYEEEFRGYVPQFLEKDEKNDPRFAQMYNSKPGHDLLFQTTPLFIGPLMQAKCVQCHLPSYDKQLLLKSYKKEESQSQIDALTLNYQRGRELYISQACYACHRIAGLTRGGVGPELTRAATLYPWYLKESIVWPQADLPTSTMPNYHLDHLELQDLMTFLLAQTDGRTKAISQQDYKTSLLAWESGSKLPWEKALSPAKIHDIRNSMQIFAEQGCASCHRLEGYESNVGYKIEKEKVSFDQLYDESQWFRKLFPETIHLSHFDEDLHGTQIVTQIEKHQKEIDERIVSDVRQNSILEEIERKSPGTIESFYSNFQYAARAKDAFFDELEKQTSDAEKRKKIQEEHSKWKNRVHRVLMIFIQEYGLGRLVGPRPNWSGIYRSDEWLMEHFRNPSFTSPRSLMPAFPFDDTKFYALTYLLDKLAIENRNKLQTTWAKVGFDPSATYETLCSQCHGTQFLGKGPVAQWIYPIPKNLRDADFLRNLTKERAIDSITHGVRGTPMPPWGEVSTEKPEDILKESKEKPVLSKEQIHYLVDWLYSGLAGNEVIEKSTDVPKWEYQPEDVIKELKNEGGNLSSDTPLSFLYKGKGLLASLTPMPANDEVSDYFDRVPNPSGPDPYHYYIKKEFYTKSNIEEGESFFHLNCAPCHGSEADGSGIRAEVMDASKPRMLTNLNWIDSRDDLRLLRSIKFGVPGTAMTPWGDLTSSLQRMQLVIYIRNLSAEQEKRNQLTKALYQAFDEATFTIQGSRIDLSKQIEDLENQKRHLNKQQKELQVAIVEDNKSPEEAVKSYEEILQIEQKINRLKKEDDQLQNLLTIVKKEKELYFLLGMDAINKGIDLAPLLQLIQQNENRYEYNHKLIFHSKPTYQENRSNYLKLFFTAIDQEISHQEDKAKIQNLEKFKTKVTKETEEALNLYNEQQKITENLNKEPLHDTL